MERQIIDQLSIRKPRNSWETFKWSIFEPILLEKYSGSLTRRESKREFLKSYRWVVLFSISLYLITNFITAALDLPVLFKTIFSPEIVKKWPVYSGLFFKFLFLLKLTLGYLAIGLVFGLVFGLVVGIIRGLSFGLAVGLALGLAFGLAIWLVRGLAIGLAIGLSLGLSFGLAGGLSFGLAVWLAVGLTGGLAIGLAVGLAIGLTGVLAGGKEAGFKTGVGMMLGWYIGYFRIFPVYIYHFFKSLFCNRLNRNPYWKDGVIWLPIPGLNSKLIRQIIKNPDEASRFIDFLIEYRPLQKNLAMHQIHAASAARWRLHPLDADILKQIPLISKDKPKFQPSDQWFQKLVSLREELVASQQQSSIGLKLEYFERFKAKLEEFREITLRQESSRWNHYYLDTLNEWIHHAGDELHNLQLLAQSTEPITHNRYRAGDALDPQFDQLVFMGRDDLKDTLQQKILSSPQMPLFLVHGQRRVGKTSLLKFLPLILGPRFKVVYLDLQNLNNVHHWFTQLQITFHQSLELPISEPLPETGHTWPETWKILQSQLEKAASEKDYKIILAFDEYEKLHRLMQSNPGEAAGLLDAMRSFSQHQNKIVFLFVGATFFSELDQPRWSDYFVQAILMEVDYLTAPQTRRLIEVAELDYPDDVIDSIYDITQGHPTLVQRICLEMVNVANTTRRKHMTIDDLDQVLNSHIYRPQNGVTDVFWRQFCELPTLKQAVRDVMNGSIPADKKALFALKEHGFIVQEKDHYKMRVPVFHKWVEMFGDVIN